MSSMDEEQQAQNILSHLNQLKQERQQVITKISELDAEHTEHNLVINTLEPLPRDRRCFRMIGEVLVERTNAEVLQAVSQNRDQLKKAMEEMAERLKAKERELLEHIKKHNIRQTSDVPSKGQGQSDQAGRSSGVLV